MKAGRRLIVIGRRLIMMEIRYRVEMAELHHRPYLVRIKPGDKEEEKEDLEN